MAFCPSALRTFILLQILAPLAEAQNIAVSATASWSSQIVAFWGAVLIGQRVSEPGRVTSALASEFSALRVERHARAISNALVDGDWFVVSGWNNGRVRLDVAIIVWTNKRELRRLARRVTAQIETLGDRWEVLIIGRHVEGGTGPGVVNWIKCPRSAELCTVRDKETRSAHFPLRDEDLVEALRLFKELGVAEKDGMAIIIDTLTQRCLRKATRPAYQNEVSQVVDGIEGDPSWARIFTGLKQEETPFIYTHVMTDAYGSGKRGTTHGAVRMYSVVHLTIAVAIGLMGAASGRGLAVWLMSVRLSLANLGAANIPGQDYLLSLISIDGCNYFDTMPSNSNRLAGEVQSNSLPGWVLTLTAMVPILETLIIAAGWIYGALNSLRLAPSGVVGNGMLGLSTLTAMALSIRALLGVKQRLSGRLLGIWSSSHGIRLALGVRSLRIPVDKIVASPEFSKSALGLIVAISREPSTEENFVLDGLLRHPLVGTLVQQFLITEILQYQYEIDDVVARGGESHAVSTKSEYPWIQTSICIIVTMISCCVCTIYAYYPLPVWVRYVTEIIMAANVMWFSTLERVAFHGLLHDRGTYLCFMVASLVVSSIWYVGVEGVG
ncbi:hypothetical protein OIDMADRAFT_165397 [Oidiodendron maius Zn]|uniref:Uncharacterized protein n=1 Tax=Oidiodendron maius (strain Zn) TaxID=913774 RepID=A0A0C3DFQ1_OIDMZ|nr:hypothetical protein OIDMADRAFT_165397 [Oidiodendron maius Zn]